MNRPALTRRQGAKQNRARNNKLHEAIQWSKTLVLATVSSYSQYRNRRLASLMQFIGKEAAKSS